MVLAHMGLIDPRAYIRMAAILRQPIADGTLHNPVGELPRLHASAKSTDTHGLPVARALRMLEAEGLLTRIPGLGYHVRVGPQPTVGRDTPVPSLFRQSMKRHGN